MREQRLVFGEVAELYDRARAGYPDAAIDDVISFTGSDGPHLRALEVGAGTGKATAAFAARGLEIVALEPSAEMAAVARRNCQPFPGVRVESASFEDWPAAAGGFGLVFSAQAWHWITPGVRYRKAPRPCARAARSRCSGTGSGGGASRGGTTWRISTAAGRPTCTPGGPGSPA